MKTESRNSNPISENMHEYSDNKEIKKINSLSKNWDEYIKKNTHKYVYYINNAYELYGCYLYNNESKNILPTFRLCEGIQALYRLLCLRHEYINGWEPNWEADDAKYVIQFNGSDIQVQEYCHISRVLSFQSEELAQEFVKNFKGLILRAKELL